MKTNSYLAKILIISIFFTYFIGGYPPTQVHAQNPDKDIMDLAREAGYNPEPSYRPKSSILIDGNSGQVLWEESADLPWNPASIGKVMTLYLAFEAMSQGKFTLETKVKATKEDQAISKIFELSNNDIFEGVEYPVSDLLYMITTPSSNVATFMIANLVSDNDQAGFINKMNEAAAKLGMTQSVYYNCSGAQASAFQGYYTPEGIDPNGDNVSSARDLSILTYNLIKNYPDVLNFTKEPKVTVMKGTQYEESFDTYNYSLPGAEYGFEGVDGLKTGSSPTGGFNYIFTAKQKDTRLIGVVLGVGDWSDQDGEYQRHPFGNGLLKYGFDNFEYKQLLPKGNTTINGKNIILDNDLYGTIKKGTEPTFTLGDDNVISNQTDLATVSPQIKLESVTFKTENQTQSSTNASPEAKTANKEATSSRSTKEYIFSGTTFFSGICLLFLAYFIQRSNKRSRHARLKKPTFIINLGILFILIAIGSILWTSFIGNWSSFLFK